MRNPRPCLGCEGDGWAEHWDGYVSGECPVCLGSGTVSTRLGYHDSSGRWVPDAVADAEALMRITQSAHGVESVERYGSGAALFAAAKYGADLAWHMRSGVLPPYRRRSSLLRAFRAAFRAVPALKVAS